MRRLIKLELIHTALTSLLFSLILVPISFTYYIFRITNFGNNHNSDENNYGYEDIIKQLNMLSSQINNFNQKNINVEFEAFRTEMNQKFIDEKNTLEKNIKSSMDASDEYAEIKSEDNYKNFIQLQLKYPKSFHVFPMEPDINANRELAGDASLTFCFSSSGILKFVPSSDSNQFFVFLDSEKRYSVNLKKQLERLFDDDSLLALDATPKLLSTCKPAIVIKTGKGKFKIKNIGKLTFMPCPI